MLQFVIAGLVLGGIYAIGVGRFGHHLHVVGNLELCLRQAIAYFIALLYLLHTQESWAIAARGRPLDPHRVACARCPLLYAGLFRHLRLSSPLIKVVATIGLLVAIPSVATLIFGNQPIEQAPGLAPEPVAVYHLAGCVGHPGPGHRVRLRDRHRGGGAALTLRYSEIGLKVRAMVDSPAMTGLSGTSPNAVSVGVWAVSTLFAGLVGVLAAPIIGLDPDNFTLLIAASLAAVVAAKLRNLPVAVLVGLLMGVATSLIQGYLPADSNWTTEVIDAVPFTVVAIFLIYSLIRGGPGSVNARGGVGRSTGPSRPRERADWPARRAA